MKQFDQKQNEWLEKMRRIICCWIGLVQWNAFVCTSQSSVKKKKGMWSYIGPLGTERILGTNEKWELE